MPSSRGLLINIFLALATALVFFFLSEAAYRIYLVLRLPPPPAEEKVVWNRYDPRAGWKHIPRARLRKVIIDRWGSRVGEAKEIDRPLPEKVILALGDSFTFGDGVRGTETWPYLLNKKIDNTRVGVLNQGVCAYGIDQMYLLYREIKEELHPEIVIVAIISWDMQRMLKSRWKEGRRHKPRYVYREGELELTNVPVPLEGDYRPRPTYPGDILFNLKKSFLLTRLLPAPPPPDIPPVPPEVYRREGIELNRYAEGVLLAQKVIERWRREVEGEGKRFLLVLIPLKDRLTYYHSYLNRLKDNLRKKRVEIVDTQDALRKKKEEGARVFRGAHPSPGGYEVIASEIYYYLVGSRARAGLEMR